MLSRAFPFVPWPRASRGPGDDDEEERPIGGDPDDDDDEEDDDDDEDDDGLQVQGAAPQGASSRHRASPARSRNV